MALVKKAEEPDPGSGHGTERDPLKGIGKTSGNWDEVSPRTHEKNR